MRKLLFCLLMMACAVVNAQLSKYDVNNDLKVNSADIVEIYNYIINGGSEDPDDGTYTVNGVSFKMIAVDGGTFQMGSTTGYYDEEPAHSVTLSSYSIGETEVTQALWKAVMGSNPSYFKGDNLPVERVSWNDCQTFITKLNQLTGKTFRLPTEAEWEFAAKGGTKSKGYTYSGSNTIGDVAWYKDNSGSKTHPVATKQANELGIYDMSGNVWEWCQDWYGSYSSTAQSNPTGPTSGSDRVCRGGSWHNDYASYCRSAYRDYFIPSLIDNSLGFRLVLSAQLAKYDVNNDLKVNSADVVEIYNYIINGGSEDPDPSDGTYTVNGVSFNMLPIEGGTFTMGSNFSNVCPAHQVTLSSYSIGETEVTQALWKAVMGSNPSNFRGDNLPVERVSWNDCQTFITKLNQLTGKTFRLPTEAEWEFAARGGNRSQGYQYSGSNTIGDVAWYRDNSGESTHDVKTKAPNELGIYDMSGNVSEWCQDWKGSYSSTAQSNPTGPTSGSSCVHRGGSWNHYASYCHSADRDGNGPGCISYRLGFRLALSK